VRGFDTALLAMLVRRIHLDEQVTNLSARASVPSSAGGSQQSVGTPQAARGWARPPCRHFPPAADPILLPWVCFRGEGSPSDGGTPSVNHR
jgi:hypothetical protein